MTMHHFTFLAVPTPDAQEFQDSGGAYVSCWIQGDDRQEAEKRAAGLIEEYGWSVEALEEASTVTGADYGPEEEDREFYEQALMEGEVLVFNTWPLGEGDEDDEDLEDLENLEEDREGTGPGITPGAGPCPSTASTSRPSGASRP